MQKINQKYIKTIVQQSLREDLRPSGDITSKIIRNKKITAKIIAGQNCIVGGLNFAKEAFKISDKKITFKAKTKDGRKINRGKVIAILRGNASGILKSERVALNFLGLVSGVATTTNQFVKKVKYSIYLEDIKRLSLSYTCSKRCILFRNLIILD